MREQIETDRYAKASGRKEGDEPVREAIPRPNPSSRVHLRMWKSAAPNRPEAAYIATFKAPFDVKAGEVLILECYLVEQPALTAGEKPRRGFEGLAYRATRMLKGATLGGDPTALPTEMRDLFSSVNELPFNDPLPENPR